MVISGVAGGETRRQMEERLARLEEIVNMEPGLANRLRTIDERIQQLSVSLSHFENKTCQMFQCFKTCKLE